MLYTWLRGQRPSALAGLGRRAPPVEAARRVNAPEPLVQGAEAHRAKVHGPQPVVDFFEADVFARQDLADVDVRAVPLHPAVREDATHVEVSRILHRG